MSFVIGVKEGKKNMKRIAFWTLGVVVLAGGAFAQQPNSDEMSPEQYARTAQLQAIQADRSGAVEDLVNRWSGSNGANRGDELREVASTVSAESLLAASDASTYKGVVNALLNGGQEPAVPGEKAFGDTASDLVFFPVAPCRIVDTRYATGAYAGRIVAGTPRSYYHNTTGNIGAQGGNTLGCGIPMDPAAIAITVTSVSPLAAGNLIGYPYNTTAPTTSINNYAVVSGLANANTTILKTSQLAEQDFTIAVNGGAVHVVIDIVGYFWSPVRPICRTVSGAYSPTGSFSYTATCASGELYMGGGCDQTSWITGFEWWQNGPSDANTGHTCRGYVDHGGTAGAMTVYARCCDMGR